MKEPIDTLELSFTVKAPNECPCGSGKKPKRCCGELKDRTYSIQMDPANFLSHGLNVSLSDMSVERVIGNKKLPLYGASTITQSYGRSKGPKDLVVAPITTNHSTDPNTIFLDYDHIYAIDTNTKEFNNSDISISAVMRAYLSKKDGKKVWINYEPVTFLEFRKCEEPPENIGWMALCMAIEAQDAFKGLRIGIIVDSMKGSLKDFNSRKLPICDDYYLPEKFQLIYASADSGNEIANKLIKRCDKQSSNLLKWILDNDFSEGLQPSSDYPCSLFRQLEPSWDDPSWRLPIKTI